MVFHSSECCQYSLTITFCLEFEQTRFRRPVLDTVIKTQTNITSFRGCLINVHIRWSILRFSDVVIFFRKLPYAAKSLQYINEPVCIHTRNLGYNGLGDKFTASMRGFGKNGKRKFDHEKSVRQINGRVRDKKWFWVKKKKKTFLEKTYIYVQQYWIVDYKRVY